MKNYNFFSKQMNDGDGVSLSTPLTATIQAHRACMPYSIRIGGKRQESRVERQESRDKSRVTRVKSRETRGKRQEARVGRGLLRRVAAVVLCLLTVGVAQMWADKANEMRDGDNPPVGILLCTQKGNQMVEYATAGMYKNLFVSTYQLHLPDKSTLEHFLEEQS